MTEFWDILAVVAIALALLSVWYAQRLGKQVKDLKRKEFYVEQKLNGITKEIVEAVDPLRLQLAAIAAGHSVPDQLIRTGRLYENVTADEAERIIAQEQKSKVDNVIIVDVRTPREFSVRHIPGAKLIPVEQLENRYGAEIPRTCEKVFIYCAMGDRSRLACDYLSRQGYLNLYNISDGLQKWKGSTAGNPPQSLIQIQSKSTA
jgi:rhodanese-related sulfurtransferase